MCILFLLRLIYLFNATQTDTTIAIPTNLRQHILKQNEEWKVKAKGLEMEKRALEQKSQKLYTELFSI